MAVVTATVLRGSGGRRGSRRGRGAAVESSRHWLRPLDRLGFMGWSGGGGDEPRSLCRYAVPSSTPLYMAQCDGGPPAIGLGAPDQGAGQGPLEPLGSRGGRSI
ncbi:hypothetical protein [Oryza sativa Japonica Group]|uniref:Uncharacterized protein n=1 Tax=Oryza sativa subsp. japonica TaxID=39947 RepID=Q5ZD46_ORYSJ|nr:hypothetical protein [Oryza sativa Japonica Group]